LWNYVFCIIYTRLSLVGMVVSDTQPRLMCRLADDPVPLVMGVLMSIQLTLVQLNCLVC
jgi:hypothetical protein